MDYHKEAECAFEYMLKVNGFPVMKELKDLSQGELAILGYLTFKQDGSSAGELSKEFEVGSSRIAAILNALTKKGYAKREVDSKDGRKVLVYATDKGREEAILKKDMAHKHMVEFLQSLGEDDAREFLRIMKKAAMKEMFLHP